VRERRREQIVLLIWFFVPIALISIGSSKLEHYVYPFLPPLALAAGAVTTWLLSAGRHYAVSAMTAIQRRVGGVSERSTLRYVMLGIAGIAAAIAIATFLFGTLEWTVGETRVFRNTHVARPLAVALLLAVVAGRGAMAAKLMWPVIVLLAVIPVNAYENTWKRTLVEQHPLRDMRACLTRVQLAERAAGRPGPGVYAIGQHRWFVHSYYYYLRDLGWDAVDGIDQRAVDAAIVAPGYQRPVMIDERTFWGIRMRYRDIAVPRLALPTTLVLMPGPYGECDAATATRGAER
jgi:hypothetical protein